MAGMFCRGLVAGLGMCLMCFSAGRRVGGIDAQLLSVCTFGAYFGRVCPLDAALKLEYDGVS